MDNHEKAEQERRVYRRMILFFAGILVLLVGYSCYAVINRVKMPEQVIVTEETLQNTATVLPEKSGNVHQLTEEDTRWSGYEDYLKKQLSYIEEKERVTAGLGTGFDVAGPVTKDSLNCIVKKDGKWGMFSFPDESGCFFIDEALNSCSGYIMENVDYCFPGYIRKNNNNYLVKWIGKEEE